MVLSADHITGATGKLGSLVVTLTKNNAVVPVAAIGTIVELTDGEYQLEPNTNDASVLGALTLHATATGCDPCDDNSFTVVDYDPSSYSINNPVAVTPGALTIRDVITEALGELGVVSAVDPSAPEDMEKGLRYINRIIDSWNGDRACIFAEQFITFTTAPGVSPQTIGPTGTCVVNQRPVSIDGANFLQNTGALLIRNELGIHDQYWWLAQTVPLMQTSWPTDLYYQPDWPNGSIFLWPVPSGAYVIELMIRQVLPYFDLTTQLSMPPGYREALTLTLAEALVRPMQIEMPQGLPYDASKARARMQRNNVVIPRLATADSGLRGGYRPSTFDWRKGYGYN